MDYLNEAFGGFEPQVDKDAAVKFCLSIILMDRRIDELADLLTEGHYFGGLAGDPGWLLKRRDEGKVDNPGYAAWPAGARFLASVDPKGYQLAYPEFYMDKATFHRYVLAALQAYVKLNPVRAAEADRALVLLR